MKNISAKATLKYIEYCNSAWGKRREELIWHQLNPQLQTNARVLDLGCGPGKIAVRFAKIGYQVVAVDHSEEMLEYLFQESKTLGCIIELIPEDAIVFLSKVPADNFDLILCHNLLEYIEKKRNLLKLIFKCTKAKGKVSLITQNRYGETLKDLRSGKWQSAEVLHKHGFHPSGNFGLEVYLFTPSEVEALLDQADLVVERWWGVGITDITTSHQAYSEGIQTELMLSQEYPYRDQATLMHFLCSKKNTSPF